MGRSQNKKTPLQCMLDNFKKGDYGVELTPQKLWRFCEIDCVSFKVGWPSEGSLEQETICRVYQVVTGTPGHPEYFPYIDIWQTLVAHPPPWLKKCFEDSCKIMMARTTNMGLLKERKREKRFLSQCNRLILTCTHHCMPQIILPCLGCPCLWQIPQQTQNLRTQETSLLLPHQEFQPALLHSQELTQNPIQWHR
jgi:hypothetical protein